MQEQRPNNFDVKAKASTYEQDKGKAVEGADDTSKKSPSPNNNMYKRDLSQKNNRQNSNKN